MKREYYIAFDEIYYASTQKSALTGAIGFGVRSFTEGLTSKEVSEIAGAFAPTYPVPMAKSVTMAQLQQNPDIVLGYPATYEYRKLDIGDGTKRYVLARTVYVGVEYGYFCHGSANRAGSNFFGNRPGSNFFTHMLVFKQEPPFALLDDVVAGRVCLPFDGSASPDNPEWQTLLTGEPKPIPRREALHFEADDDDTWITDPRFLLLAKALLQANMNEKMGTDSMLQKIMVKTTIAQSPELVRLLSHMPASLLSRFPFTSNVMNGTMPTKYRLAMMNEWNTSQQFPDHYVFVDFTTGRTSNISDNFLFSKMHDLAIARDGEKLVGLIDFFLKVDYNHPEEYSFLYNIFLAVHTNDSLPIEQIDNTFIDKTIPLGLDDESAGKLWNKINATFKKCLLHTDNPSNMVKAIEMAHYCRSKNCSLLHFDSETISQMTSLLFRSEKNLANLTTRCTPDMLIPLVDLSQVPEDNFFDALRSCGKTNVWSYLVKQFYSGKLDNQLDRILGELMASRAIGDIEREQLRETFYPIHSCSEQLFQWFLSNPDAIKPYRTTVSDLCATRKDEVYSALINARQYTHAEVAATLADSAMAFFRQHLTDGPIDNAVSELVAFCDKVTPSTFCAMRLDTLFKPYADTLFQEPTTVKLQTVESVLGLSLQPSDANGLNGIDHVKRLIKQLDFKANDLQIEDLLFDLHRNNGYNKYSLKLLSQWISTSQRTFRDVRKYLAAVDWKSIKKGDAEQIIYTLWDSRMNEDDKVDSVMEAIRLTSWKKEELKAFVDSCTDSKQLLADTINKEKPFFKSLKRFSSKLFSKSK